MSSLLFPGFDKPTERLALSLGSEQLSQRELIERAKQHLAGLSQAGLRPGDRVGVWTHPSIDTAIALSAQAAAGFVAYL